MALFCKGFQNFEGLSPSKLVFSVRAASLHDEDCHLKQQGRLGVSHERGPGLGAGHLAEDMTSELRCLPGDERAEVPRGTS